MRDKPTIPLRLDPDAARDAAVVSFVRAAIATGLAALTKSRPSEIARERYNGDRGLDIVLRAAVSPTTLANSPAATQIAAAFLDALTATSAGAELFDRGVKLNFAGNAQIVVPAVAIPSAGFIGEGAAIPVKSAPTTPGPTLVPHKLATIAVLTGEMMRSSNAEEMVRRVLIESCGPALDGVLFSANAATADAPAGLLAGIAALTPAAAGEKQGALVDDLQKLGAAVAPVAGNSDVVIVASADAAIALALRVPQPLKWPILTSSSLAARTVIAVAAAAIVSAIDGPPAIDARGETAINLADPASEIVTAGGTIAYPVGSVYQTDSVALRMRWKITWALRDTRGLAWMSNVNW